MDSFNCKSHRFFFIYFSYDKYFNLAEIETKPQIIEHKYFEEDCVTPNSNVEIDSLLKMSSLLIFS